MKAIKIMEKNISTAIFQFIIPFSIKEGSEPSIYSCLERLHLVPFQLSNLEQEKQFYGKIRVSHHDLEKYFVPFTNKLLFPEEMDKKGFRRYSKEINLVGILKNPYMQVPFTLHSIDVIICPFEQGFITLRTEITNQTLSKAIEFASSLKTMNHVSIEFRGDVHWTLSSLLFDCLVPGLYQFVDENNSGKTLFGSLPFTNEGDIYVQTLIIYQEKQQLDVIDIYRIGVLNGLDAEGNAFIEANNPDYIKKYVEENSYDCWLPSRGYFLTDCTFTCIAKEDFKSQTIAGQMYGEIYYSLLIHLFHRMVFLKIIHQYAGISVENNTKKVGKLIYLINSFTSNYFFLISPSQTKGKELFNLLRKQFHIDYFYDITKETLFTLFKYEENSVTKKDSALLLILTVYTVICGIFSMNLYTHDLVGNIPWSHLNDYNPFETFAVIVVFSGIMVAWFLLLQSLFQAYIKRKDQKKWVQQTFLFSKKPTNK